MGLWPEEFVALSIDDLLQSQVENRAWHKELRAKTAALVENRLLKTLSHMEYVQRRNEARSDYIECNRRATILTSELRNRGYR